MTEIKVSPQDAYLLKRYKWNVVRSHRTFYAVAYHKGRTLLMHKLVVWCPRGLTIDHKNRNGLDNRRSNLRVCTQTQNKQNATKRRDNSTGFKGVIWNEADKRFRARIGANGKRLWLGNFKTAVEAAKAYDKAAKKLHGQFAVLNFEGRA